MKLHRRPIFPAVILLVLSAPAGRPADAAPLVRATSSYDGAWIEFPPPSRWLGTMIYDPVRDRLVAFGGFDGSRDPLGHALSTNEVWVLPLAAPGGWTRLETTGAPPSPRLDHTAIYDPGGDRMVVFGGRGSDTTPFDDVWALGFSGTPTWTQLPAAGPAPGPREGHAAVYDGAGQRMLIFGGTSNIFQWAVHNDVWALSLTGSPAWTELTPASGPAPAPREGPSAIYDPASNRMVVFAGINASSYLADVWSLSLSGTPAWSQITPGTGPCPRDGAGAVYDPGADRMLVFGGEFFADGCPSGFFNDVWSLPLSGSPAWSELTRSGAAPAARLGQGVAYDLARRRMLVYGGYGYDQYARPIISHTMNDTWALSLGETPAWSLLDSGPRPETGRWDLATAYDAARDRWIVFGGSAGIETVDRLGDLWAAPLDRPSAWSPLAATGTPPPPLSNAAAVMDSAGERMFVIGGFDGAYENQVWLLGLAGAPAWSPVAVGGTPPPPRRGHTAVLDRSRNRAIVFGGADGLNGFNDVWALTLGSTPQWAPILTTGASPATRTGHGAIYDAARDRMIVYGGEYRGFRGPIRLNDVWELTFSGAPTWNQLLPSGTPPVARSGAAMVYDLARDRLVVWGGTAAGPSGSTRVMNDGWALALGTGPEWIPLAPAGIGPAARARGGALYDPARDRMVLFGGTGEDDTWALAWGASTAPGVQCPGDIVWSAGQPLSLSYGVTNHLGTPATYDCTISSRRSWPGLPITVQVALDPGETASLPVTLPVPDTAAAGLDAITFRAALAGAPALAGSCDHNLHDATTAVLASLVSASAGDGVVRLTWQVSSGGPVNVYRSRDGHEWDRLATLAPDGAGRVSYVDQNVDRGALYGYRLGLAGPGGEVAAGETWIEVPAREVFALEGARPNPAVGRVTLSFSLPDDSPAVLELMDPAGRRVLRREVGGMGAGFHVLPVGDGSTPGNGIYLVRLSRQGRVLTTRLVLLR